VRHHAHVWIVGLGLSAWLLLALFTWLDVHHRESHTLALTVTIANFVLYLLEIASPTPSRWRPPSRVHGHP
jgi:hypothetical protein